MIFSSISEFRFNGREKRRSQRLSQLCIWDIDGVRWISGNEFHRYKRHVAIRTPERVIHSTILLERVIAGKAHLNRRGRCISSVDRIDKAILDLATVQIASAPEIERA